MEFPHPSGLRIFLWKMTTRSAKPAASCGRERGAFANLKQALNALASSLRANRGKPDLTH
jgi:hypothetical protein